MKKYISYLLASALMVPGIVSCNRLQEEEIPARTHRVHFSATQAETRTGLSIEGKTVTPDWNKTAVENIHLFEIDGQSAVAYGETLGITTDNDKTTAQFEADFPENLTISFGTDGSSQVSASASDRVAPFRYAAVIAKKPSAQGLSFVVPAEQHPDAATLKDPAADFLVGFSAESLTEPHFFEEPVVDLYFTRAAAMGRVAISNFSDSGEKVQSVTIKTAAGLTGSAAYSDIDFENGTVTFTRVKGDLTLVYDNGAAVPASGPFYAYFVAIPGEATITSIEVVTDEFIYTKEIGKASTFSAESFKNFTLDLSTATKEAATQKWYVAEEIEVGETYLIVSNKQALKNDGSAVSVTEESGVIVYNAPDEVLWTAATYSSSSSKFFFKNGDNYLTRGGSSSSYTPSTSSSSSTSSSTYNLWTYDSGNVYLYATSTSTSSSASKYYLFYDTSESKFRMSSTTPSSTNGRYTALYTTTKPKAARELAFDKESVVYDLLTDAETTFAFPILSGVTEGVTYSSSETSVATVDPTSGKVSIQGVGTTVIKAEAGMTADYKAGSAEYTLKVVNGVSRFYRAEEMVAGEEYLIYSNGYILQNNSGSPAAVAATVDGDMIALDDVPETILWTATASSGKFTLSNDGRFLYRTSSSYKAQLSTSNQLEWSYDAENEFLNTVMSSSTYCFYYSTNNSEYRINTQDTDHHAILFVMDDGQPRAQKLEFTPGSLSFNINGKTTPVSLGSAAPTLSGAKTAVTYSSNATSVAEVNASTGAVTVKGIGTATITATAVATDKYLEGKASYTLKVVNVASPTMGSVESSFDLRVSSSTIVRELSGLCLSKDGDFLWGVGDKGTLYKINFDGTSSTQWANGGTNMEGLAMDPKTGTMYMCFEPDDVYTLSDPYTSKTLLFEVAEASNMNNDGVEGIAWADGYLYLGSQTNATLWKYNVNGTKVWTKQLKSVAPTITEVAGLDYDQENDWLWVLDSEVKALYLFDGEATTLYATYDLSSIATQNPEGVCVDRKNGCIWICEDAASGSSPSKLHKIAFSNLGVN